MTMTMTQAERERVERGRRRWALLRKFVKSGQSRVTAAAGVVWYTLFAHAKPTGFVRLSQGTIGRLTGMSERSIRRRLVELERAKLLHVQQRGSPGFSSAYLLKAPAELPETDPDTGHPCPHVGHACPDSRDP
jgi:hypothetical protein